MEILPNFCLVIKEQLYYNEHRNLNKDQGSFN